MLILKFSESDMIPFSDSTKFKMYNLALTKREGGSTFFLYFYGYRKCYYSCFDTLSRGHRLGVNFSRKKTFFFC